MKENDIQAFPVSKEIMTDYYGGYSSSIGMTLKDYFAAKVLNGWCSNRDQWSALCEDKVNLGKGMSTEEYIAQESYKLADAMLKERNK